METTAGKGRVIDIAEGERFRASLMKQKFKFNEVIEMDERKTGTDGGGIPYRAPQSKAHAGDDSTLMLAPSKRFLIAEGIYLAMCVDVGPLFYWRRFGKWQVKLEFEIKGAPGPIIKCADISRTRERPKEINPHSLLGRNLCKVGGTRLDVLLGQYFMVTVKTVKHTADDADGDELRELPKAEWYSYGKTFRAATKQELAIHQDKIPECDAEEVINDFFNRKYSGVGK